jgi:hypothetical protein
MAGRRLSIAVRLVELGFITADRATPENPAVEVLSELLPPDAELGLCLSCHGFSSSARYRFAARNARRSSSAARCSSPNEGRCR